MKQFWLDLKNKNILALNNDDSSFRLKNKIK